MGFRLLTMKSKDKKFKPRISEIDKDGKVWWQVTPSKITYTN